MVFRPTRSWLLAAWLLAPALGVGLVNGSATASEDDPPSPPEDATAPKPAAAGDLQRGEAALKAKRFKQARELLLRARSQARQAGDAPRELEALMLLGQLETVVKNHGLARHYVAQARALLEQGSRPSAGEAASSALPQEAPEKTSGEAAEDASEESSASAPASPAPPSPNESEDAKRSRPHPTSARASAADDPATAPLDLHPAESPHDASADGATPASTDASMTDTDAMPPLEEREGVAGAVTEIAAEAPEALNPAAPKSAGSSVTALELAATALFVLAMGGLGALVGWWRQRRARS